MRYTRLRRQIESGTLIGTHGTPFAGGAEKIAEALRKRKKSNPLAERKMNGDDEEMPDQTGKGVKRGFSVVKNEESSEYESDFGDSGDSEDEIPLAKLRRAKMGEGRARPDYDRPNGGGSIGNPFEAVAGGARIGLELPNYLPSADRFSPLPPPLPPILGLTSSIGDQTWERDTDTKGLIHGYVPQAPSHDSLYAPKRTMY